MMIPTRGPHRLRRAGWRGKLGVWLWGKRWRRLGTWVGFVAVAQESVDALRARQGWTVTR